MKKVPSEKPLESPEHGIVSPPIFENAMESIVRENGPNGEVYDIFYLASELINEQITRMYLSCLASDDPMRCLVENRDLFTQWIREACLTAFQYIGDERVE